MRKVFVDVEQNLVDPQRVLMTITWLHALGGVPPANIIAGSIRGLYDDRSTRVCVALNSFCSPLDQRPCSICRHASTTCSRLCYILFPVVFVCNPSAYLRSIVNFCTGRPFNDGEQLRGRRADPFVARSYALF